MAYAETLLWVIGLSLLVWYLTKVHYEQKFWPYCKEHPNIKFTKDNKFCWLCGKPLYKKELKETQIK